MKMIKFEKFISKYSKTVKTRLILINIYSLKKNIKNISNCLKLIINKFFKKKKSIILLF